MTHQPVDFHQGIGQSACVFIHAEALEQSLSSQDFSSCHSVGIAVGERSVFFKIQGEFADILENQGSAQSFH